MNFMENLRNTINDEKSITENGAVGYRTTGKQLLDLNFSVSSLRNKSENEIEKMFANAFYENKLFAVKWLFMCRDVRGGLGERRTFRICMKYLATNHCDIAKAVLKLLPEYGRWDDLIDLVDTDLKHEVVNIIKDQLNEDMINMRNNKPASLCAKWMPSKNASSIDSKRKANIITDILKISDAQYRKMLSKLRSYLDVVEVKMSRKRWEDINYETVPSRANLIYNNAFLRNDEERRRAYLSKLEKGEANINSSVLFPHDIVNRYDSTNTWYSIKLNKYDPALESMWKGLPDYVNGNNNTICVADGSGSMTSYVGGTNVTALDVANALAIYFSERCSGQFKNKYITFSSRPQFVDFSSANSLREKIEIALRHNECSDTNIEAVFNLILNTAINNNLSQNDIPQNILILSDMEFDSCAMSSRGYCNETLFDSIAKKYSRYGYKLPRLVFWNICSRTGTIPVKENKLGVALVSGFSPSIVKMVLSNNTDPYKCLLEQINSERYYPVENAIKDLVE